MTGQKLGRGDLELPAQAPIAPQGAWDLTLAELAEAVMGETDRRNTLRAFESDWDRWVRFCEAVTSKASMCSH